MMDDPGSAGASCRTSRWSARALVTGSMCVAFVAVTALPADAHTRTEETTNVVSRVTHDPTPQDVRVRVHTGGLLVEVENLGAEEIVVAGYDGEPYLSIGPEVVRVNRRSPAAHLNRDRFGDVAMPPDVDPTAEPEWVVVERGSRHLWHDHRTHWMSPEPPPFVEAGALSRSMMRARLVGAVGRAGAQAGTFQEWQIPLTVGGAPMTLRGELAWEDPPPASPWLIAAALVVLAAFVGTDPRDRGAATSRAALVLGAVAAVNGIHLVDDLLAWPSDPLDELFGLLHTTTFLAAGLAGAAWARYGGSARLLALGVGSGAVLYHQGLVHMPMLYASRFPTVWPDGVVRLTIALGLVQAIAVAFVVVRARGGSGRAAQSDPAVVGGRGRSGVSQLDP